MTDLTQLTLTEARDEPARSGFTAVELAQAHLAAMAAARPLNAYVLETPEQALAMAKASDERLAKGQAPAWKHSGGCEGPVSTAGVRTTASSKILGNFSAGL